MILMTIRNLEDLDASMTKLVYKIQLIQVFIKKRQESAPFRRYLPKSGMEGFSAN